MNMKEILKKIVDAGRKDALNSLEELTDAAKDMGYSEDEVEKALEDFDGFPIDDDDLAEIVGGLSQQTYFRVRETNSDVFS